MNAEDIPIDKIHRHENVRVSPLSDTNDVASLMISIKQFGLFSPIRVVKDGAGKDTYSIVMGNPRLTACKKLGWKTIPSFVHYDIMEYKEFLLRNTSENLERKNIDEMELGRIFNELNTDINIKMEPTEIAVRFSIAPQRVTRCIQLYHTVPTEYRKKIHYMADGGNLGKNQKKGRIPAHTAQKIVNMTKKRGLGKYKNDLWNLATKDGYTGKDFNILATLLNRGATLNEAIESLDRVRIISVKIPVDKKDLKRLQKKHNLKLFQLIQQILSGDIPDRLTTYDFGGD